MARANKFTNIMASLAYFVMVSSDSYLAIKVNTGIMHLNATPEAINVDPTAKTKELVKNMAINTLTGEKIRAAIAALLSASTIPIEVRAYNRSKAIEKAEGYDLQVNKKTIVQVFAQCLNLR